MFTAKRSSFIFYQCPTNCATIVSTSAGFSSEFYGVSTKPNNDGTFPEVLCLPLTSATSSFSLPLTAVN